MRLVSLADSPTASKESVDRGRLLRLIALTVVVVAVVGLVTLSSRTMATPDPRLKKLNAVASTSAPPKFVTTCSHGNPQCSLYAATMKCYSNAEKSGALCWAVDSTKTPMTCSLFHDHGNPSCQPGMGSCFQGNCETCSVLDGFRFNTPVWTPTISTQSNVADCARACVQSMTFSAEPCACFGWDKTKSHCHLHTKCVGSAALIKDSNYQSGRCDRRCVILENYSLAPSTHAHTTVNHMVQPILCQEKCHMDGTCCAYYEHAATSQCELFNTCELGVHVVSTPSSNDGIGLCGDSKSRFYFVKNVHQVSGSLVVKYNSFKLVYLPENVDQTYHVFQTEFHFTTGATTGIKSSWKYNMSVHGGFNNLISHTSSARSFMGQSVVPLGARVSLPLLGKIKIQIGTAEYFGPVTAIKGGQSFMIGVRFTLNKAIFKLLKGQMTVTVNGYDSSNKFSFKLDFHVV